MGSWRTGPTGGSEKAPTPDRHTHTSGFSRDCRGASWPVARLGPPPRFPEGSVRGRAGSAPASLQCGRGQLVRRLVARDQLPVGQEDGRGALHADHLTQLVMRFLRVVAGGGGVVFSRLGRV